MEPLGQEWLQLAATRSVQQRTASLTARQRSTSRACLGTWDVLDEKIMTGPRRCPICKRSVPTDAASSPFRPFCSERCKLVDLGSWLSGTYRISRPISEEELDQGVVRDGSGTDKPE
jgi:endogenous inhibitor of DNA gyrase (YacG/DUF329 family)